jgi:hypothetical protein
MWGSSPKSRAPGSQRRFTSRGEDATANRHAS